MTIHPRRPEAIHSRLEDFPGELAHVIEEHGRGLSTRRLCGVLDDVCEQFGELPGRESSSRIELKRELIHFLRDHRDEHERETLLDFLSRLADDLRSGSLEPTVALEKAPPRRRAPRLVVTFDSAFSLRRKLSTLLDARSFFLETEARPMPFVDLRIVIQATLPEEEVSLQGRVVRSAPNGIALRVYEPSEEAVARLRHLPGRMWEARLAETDARG